MKRMPLLIAICILVLIPTMASAQASRTWVSGVGDDVNPCSRTAPCKTFAGAISKTATGGEINVIDPGGYGSVTITKSITIDGQGPHASILAGGVNGVVINANSTATVTLRNLSINGIGNCTTAGCAGTNGIRVLNAKNVHIENVVIFGMRNTSAGVGRGVDINSSVQNTNVNLRNVTITDCLNAGVSSQGNGVGTVNLTITNSKIAQNGTGVDLVGVTRGSLVNNDISHNVGTGVNIPVSSSDCDLHQNSINFNTTGISVANGSIARIFMNQITKNGTSLAIPAGSQVISHGLNQIVANTSNVLPTSTPGTN